MNNNEIIILPEKLKSCFEVLENGDVILSGNLIILKSS